jgi:hypothetical protein
MGLFRSLATLDDQAKVPTTATIVGVRPTGSTVNTMPFVQLDLMVFRNAVPVPVTVTEVVPQVHLARVRVGENLHVTIDPNPAGSLGPGTVWIDWVTPA